MKQILLVFATASLMLAQSTITRPNGTITTPTITGTTANMATWSGETLMMNGGGGLVWATGRGGLQESRKDDGRGPTLLQVRNSARKLAANELPPVEYIKYAKDAGIDSPSAIIDEATVLNLVDSLGLKVYDWNKVDDYLYRKALRQGTNVRWVWKPIRKQDGKAVTDYNWRSLDHVGVMSAKMYAQPLPVRILKRMKEIECLMPDVVFLVSDYEVIKPDPFLAITTKELLDSNKIWIIDQWLEPGFSDGPELTAKR